MNVYILKKHQVIYGHYYCGNAIVKAFEIEEVSTNKEELDEICKQKNQRSEKYFYKVGCLKVKP